MHVLGYGFDDIGVRDGSGVHNIDFEKTILVWSDAMARRFKQYVW